MTDEKTLSPLSERREYFRIDDEVLLKIRLIHDADIVSIAERINDRMPDRFTVAANFAVSSRQMSRVLHGFASETPEVGRYLKMVDQKLNHLARLFVLEEAERGGFIPLRVNLSAGGLVFPSTTEYPVGSLLEMSMVLHPSTTGILSMSKVVYCERQVETSGTLPWQIAVEYSHIREVDRDLLVSHIMNRETEMLRRQREEQDGA